MKKSGFIFILFFIAFVSRGYAQLPNNPANLHGTLIDDGTALAKWEKVGDSLYYEITITTPATFVDHSYMFMGSLNDESFIEFFGYEHDYNDRYPGSFRVHFDAETFPYGTRTYSGVIDITGWSDEWTTIQANYQFFNGSTAVWASELFTPEGVWD